MKPSGILAIVVVLAGGLVGWTRDASRARSQQAPPAAAPAAPKEPSTQEVNDAFVERISKQIAGHEQEPAAQVFKNIQLDNLKKTPATRLLLIMNAGYSHALGVTCKYCHVEDDFSKDDKRPKRAAREMAVMHFWINQQLVKMQNLETNPQERYLNCETCHRGAVNPNEQQ